MYACMYVCILTHSRGASELIKLHLMESYCYLALSYALECFNLSATYTKQLDVWWNSVYRVKPSTSVRELIQCLSRINFVYLLYQKRRQLGRSRSLEVTDFSTDRQPVCDFLLVNSINSSLAPFPSYRDILAQIITFDSGCRYLTPRSG